MTAGPTRVLSIGSVPPEWGGETRGGVATFHRTLVEALLPGNGSGAEVIAVVTTGTPDGLPVPGFTMGAGQSRPRFLAEVIEQTAPDVVVLNHFVNAWGETLPKVAPDLPLVGVAHSWHVITHGEPAQVERARSVAAHVLPGLGAVVHGSEHCRAEGEDLGFAHPRTEVIPYPLQQAFAAPIAVGGPRNREVVYLGSLQRRKQPEVLLDALTLLGSDTSAVFAGEGEEEGALRARAKRLGIETRVRFEPHRPPGEHIPWLRTLLGGAGAMCLPSRSESFGLVYIEALACGTPVVGFGPTLAEIERATNRCCGAPLDDVTGPTVAAGLRSVLDQPWDHAGLREATLGAFGIEHVAARYASVLTEVASAR